MAGSVDFLESFGVRLAPADRGATSSQSNRTTETVIRPFQPADVDGFLALYETVFGQRRDESWFAWKYGGSPYVDHVPIVVADHDGEVVGARAFVALSMAVGGKRHLALQPADAMVHPDHRRRGIFTRMTERAIERYESSPASFFYNFPNARVAAASRKLGWKQVRERPTYYRFVDAARGAARNGAGPWLQTAGKAINPLLSGYSSLRRAIAPTTESVTVRRETAVPSERLAALYRTTIPQAIHAVRDESFYDWRFANPDWTYETYFVEDDPAAAVIVGTNVPSGGDVTKLVDVVPLRGDATRDRLPDLLDRVLEDHGNSSLIAAPALVTIEPTLSRFGFYRDSAIPLRYVTTPTNHFVRSLTGEWVVEGLSITDHRNWAITFAEDDTS